jgi:hypothetical protein
MEGTDTGDGWPADLGALNLQNGVSVTIDGGSYALDGAGLYRGLFVYAGDVTVQNLTIQNAVATGGAGANIAGGGAGLGGGLFIASGGTVTLDDVNITDNAEGGSGGGDPTAPLEPVGGGGGGLGGAGYLGAVAVSASAQRAAARAASCLAPDPAPMATALLAFSPMGDLMAAVEVWASKHPAPAG